jgi:hypothetical protein
MNVVGGVVGLVVGVLFIAIVLAPFAVPIPTMLLLVLRPVMIVSYAIVLITVYAILSSLMTTALGAAFTAFLPTASVFPAYWALSVLYLIVTVLWVLFFFLPSVVAITAGSVASLGPPIGPSALSISLPQAALLFLIILAPLHIIVTVVLYLVADSVGASSDVERFVRGLMVGFNAALNGFFGALFLAGLAPAIGPGFPLLFMIFGIYPAVITLLAATTQPGWNAWNPIVKTVIGWSTPFLPTAWPVVMLGWVLYFCNHVVNALVGWRALGGFYSIRRFSFWFGTQFIEGGVVANSSLTKPPNSPGEGWNLGSFAFITAMSAANLAVPPTGTVFTNLPTMQHEAGHNLNLGAFGSWFHLVGAIDENVPPFARHTDAYAEQLAESNVPGTTKTSIFMWS